MLELLAATAAFTVIVAVALAVLSAVTLLPFVVTLGLAEQRQFSAARWGTVALFGSVLALGVALQVVRSDRSIAWALIALPLAALGPGLLLMLTPGNRVGGRTGRHQ